MAIFKIMAVSFLTCMALAVAVTGYTFRYVKEPSYKSEFDKGAKEVMYVPCYFTVIDTHEVP